MPLLSLLLDHPAVLLSGLGLGLSLIIAIGAQNAFVLRQGARREHVTAVVIVCTISDVVLILAGVAGLGAIVAAAPWVITLMRWLGVVFLLGYGLLAAKRAWRPSGGTLSAAEAPNAPNAPAQRSTSGLIGVTLTALALTWLNPHVYLDTVVLLGSIANTHGPQLRWVFAIGACLGSVLWFTALGLGARGLSRWLSTPTAWRIIDALIAVTMITLAVLLALGS